MSTTDFPAVSVWRKTGSEYSLVGSIATYDTLDFQPRFLEAGTWEMAVPYNQAALGITTDSVCTIDWRGWRTTWVLDRFNPASREDGEGTTLTIGGPSALSILGRELAWPAPDQPLGDEQKLTPSPLVTGPAETVIRSIILDNYVTRRGDTSLTLPASNGLGLNPIRARPKFDNLLEFVAKKARLGGVGLDVNLVNTTSTRAVMQTRIWVPLDLTSRVRLSEKVGNLVSWSQTNTEPTVTRTIVTGAETGSGRIFYEATTPEAQTAALAWGGDRVTYVQGPASYDTPDLQQAGEEALKEGAQTVNVALEAADTEGLMAFRDYNVGDKVTGELVTGLEIQDVISSISVKVDGGYPEVTPTFGNPNTEEPIVSLAEIVRAIDRRTRLLEQRT